MTQSNNKRTGTLFYIYMAFLLILLIMTNSGIRPFGFLVKIPNYDKIGHILIYGIASYLSIDALKQFSRTRVSILYGPLLIAAIALIDECIQYYIPSRKGTLSDFACSIAGIVIFGCTRLIIIRHKKNK